MTTVKKTEIAKGKKKILTDLMQNQKNNLENNLNSNIDIFEAKTVELPKNYKETEQLYKRLEYAYSLYMRHNYEMAISEVEALTNRIEDDPYLEAQTWSLASMIYEKQGKLSRRKRALRKMVACIETLQKDKRYINVYKEGMLNQEFIETIQNAGGKKYAEAE